ncbi:hypothetical protein DIS24_g5933 [Lasiodiplodia hormozganensis]|uniref:Sacsin/Nov domain-containing protein n=1 Tax=Lasiodiplodia hormozganensis TaxID=869390 RepID=A0AA39YJJ6_9PEZI|nr:hypothetical protein DIS24_g5933 [Lasiodiplodia hormozganensis]
MARPYSEEERRKGRQLISDIWFDHGGLSAEDREKFRKNPSERSHLRQIQSLKQSVSAVTKRLVEDLYSKDTRFVYELIQNAEDNSYERAASQGHSPSLKFSLYPGKLVIDTNEDGFSEDDIKAICSASKTTKTRLIGYIGEKGIGFKSVFKVAKKVHIQSEPYSFSFSYSHGSEDAEDGIGMITPIQEEYYELPGNVQTRFTLTLIAQSDFNKRAEDLRSIPDSLLLFLTKLRKLKLKIRDSSEGVTEVIYSYRRDAEQGLDIIVREELTNGELDSEPMAFR